MAYILSVADGVPTQQGRIAVGLLPDSALDALKMRLFGFAVSDEEPIMVDLEFSLRDPDEYYVTISALNPG